MKLLFGLTILILIAVSLYADHRWKRWIKANREARERDRQN
jgi:hypothetical protein